MMFNEPNKFSNFIGIVTNVDEIHVYKDYSWPRMWRVRGLHGDYGLCKTMEDAISIAMDAKATLLFDAKIYVHTKYHIGFIITKIKKIKPSSQFFQD